MNSLWATYFFCHLTKNKYQLSLTDPFDGSMLSTELGDQCDKLQSSSTGARKYCQLNLPTKV